MNLTRTEAELEMIQGKRVSHDLFLCGEWITSTPDGKTIIDEQGTQFPASYFWDLRSQPHWQTDWRVVE